MQIYLDNASSVPCTKEVLERFSFLCAEYFANQESLSFQGRRSFSAVKEAQERVFSLLTGEASPQGGVLAGNTGSCVLNAAAEGVGELLNGGIVTTEAEHPALLAALKRVSARRHIPLFLCPLCRDGSLDLNSLESLLKRDKIALLAVHHIQSETGRIQDLVAARTLLDRFAPSAFFLADTIQSAGKYPLPWKEAKLDLAFVSGQKLGSPGGAFLLYRKNPGRIFSSLRTAEHLPGRCIPALLLLLGEILEKLVPEMNKNLAAAEERKKELLDAVKTL
ncbi:MAG: aminotransferase class V-fold PLP-dependent enzyme, partial [Lentisphaeria bacterium]|nr:aminotransferase class V-fold PLP-dependent enzyme [Lentisphaeria bacterium]